MRDLFDLAAQGVNDAQKMIKDRKITFSSVLSQAKGAVKYNLESAPYSSNGVFPPMGWSSAGMLKGRVSEDIALNAAQRLKNTGLLNAGYTYINLCGAWQSPVRDYDGRLQGDPALFPRGISALRADLNSMGFKLGLSASNGTFTGDNLPGSLGNERLDAETFANLGIEYLRYDFSHNVALPVRAPEIEQIILSREGEAHELIYLAHEAILDGTACLLEDNTLETGAYISGMSMGSGSAEFNISAEKSGEYILTLVMRRKGSGKRFIQLIVNGENSQDALVPAAKYPLTSGRWQFKVQLNKGDNTIKLHNPIASQIDSAAMQFAKMGNELKRAAKKPIFYSICDWGMTTPWRWGRFAANAWRTSPDVPPSWAGILGAYELNASLEKYAGNGSFNDPGLLWTGNGALSFNEGRAQFSLWCMMNAPLILGTDARSISENDEAVQILKNAEMIAIDQDELAIQCKRVRISAAQDVLIKPLSGARVAVAFFNKASNEKIFSLEMTKLAQYKGVMLEENEIFHSFDVWDNRHSIVRDELTAIVQAHDVKVFIIN